LTLIHREPERDWTVASLADAVAMSRSAFAARFTDLVGQPAMAYVAWWRMQLAYGLMRDEGLSIAEAAGRVGYRSEAAFARAFKRTLGFSPGASRTRQTAPLAPAWTSPPVSNLALA
jgi:AraC-like DNA-binding protein